MCINYALLGFYLCYFRRFNSTKRLIVYDQKSYQKLIFFLIYNNGDSFLQRIEGSCKSQIP